MPETDKKYTVKELMHYGNVNKRFPIKEVSGLQLLVNTALDENKGEILGNLSVDPKSSKCSGGSGSVERSYFFGYPINKNVYTETAQADNEDKFEIMKKNLEFYFPNCDIKYGIEDIKKPLDFTLSRKNQ